MIRLGGRIFTQADTPDEWAKAVTDAGYRAAWCPATAEADQTEIAAWQETAKKHDIMIAEVGAWSNPISPDTEQRNAALEKCKAQLDLADRIGARCCVNVTGSRDAENWAGPHPENLTDETFNLIVESVRDIVDSVKPTRTWYTLEPMPWAFPDSAESYLRLLDAIDRESVAVHLDPVNIVNCPALAYDTTKLLRHCFELLGPQIKSCHAKDIALSKELTVHLDEVAPGEGVLDFKTYLTLLDHLDDDIPLMLEHLKGEAAYSAAADHIRSVAKQAGVAL